MRSVLLSVLFYGVTALAISSKADSYVMKEWPIAKAGLLANIGPSGSKSSGAKVRALSSHVNCYHHPNYLWRHKAGLVVASPSTVNPNYLFTWTRDSALVFKTIIDQ